MTEPIPTCNCGTPYKLSRKFNNGNPRDFWLPECNCEDEALEREIAQRFPLPRRGAR